MKIEEDQIELIEDYIKCENVFDEEISKNVRNNIKKNLTKAEKLLLITPSIINMIKALIPTTKLEAVISQEDFEKIASGILEMHIGKDGNIIPTLRDPITKKIVKLINLQVTNTNPELLMTLSTLSTQILVLKSIRTMEDIQDNLFDMSRIYENDKISIVSSCKERYLQAEKTENLQLKKDMLLSIITDTENIRNKLMQSQKENINKIQNQPKKTIEKVLSFHTLSLKKIDLLMKNIKKEMKAINLASMIEFMSYHKLLEDKAAKQSLSYYLQYIEDSCVSSNDTIYITRKIVRDILTPLCKINLIGGDITSDVSVYKNFINYYKQINYSKKTFITLGNHELWDFEDVTFDSIVNEYKKIINDSNMFLVQNNLYVVSYNKIREITENRLNELSLLDLRAETRDASLIIFGGIGFAGKNEKFNANNGIYRKTISREKEIELSNEFYKLYKKVSKALYDKNVIILTHMPVTDWAGQEDC